MVSIVNTVPLQVIGYGFATAILTELVGYLLIYRTASFKRLKKDFEKYEPPSKADGEGESGGSSGKKKDAAKKKTFEAEAGRKMAVIQIVTGILTFATMIVSINIVPKMFGKAPAGVLPFEPPSFIRKITQRGLEDAAPNEFSPFFIFMLCQGSVKVLVTKMFGWGPTRKMSMFKPDMEKVFKTA
ncbi:hypothetical protein M9434_000434 [Picochlorum sp. BPE23]|nr:hypothetical protein M9434_000434 [Picochlorum sp. BPE23]KAI8106469.1 hypothetical protein M9435_001013 [Picochlorum sp. BPE23]